MKTIGLISPNLDEAGIAAYLEILPPGLRIEGRALKVNRYHDDYFRAAEQALAGLVGELAQEPLDFLMVTGELFLSYKGPGSDRAVLRAIGAITPTPASTVLTAVVNACQDIGLRRVVMASPFPEDHSARLARFLAHDGVAVVGSQSLGYDNNRDIWALPPETGFDLAVSLARAHPDADGVYMPCNKWRITSIIDRVEQELGKPVVTNTQAWIWEALRAMGLPATIPGLGRLLSLGGV